MFKLKSLKIKNFLSIKEAELDFSKPGLYLISGYNEIGGDSNGSGKSTILSAIAFALWGKTPNGLQGDSVMRWGSTDGYFVELELDGPEGVYKIHRGAAELEFSIEGKSQKGRKTEVQNLINETLHSEPDIFFSSTFFTSAMSDYLTQMGDADKKKLFKAIFRLDKVDQAYTKAKTLYDANNTKAIQAEQRTLLLKDFIVSKQAELGELQQQFNAHEDSRQRKLDDFGQQAIEKPETDPGLVFKLKRKADIHKSLLSHVLRVQGDQIETDQKIQQAYESLGAIRANISNLTSQIQESGMLQGETECDKCGGSLGDKYQEFLTGLNAQLEEAEKKELQMGVRLKELEKTQQEGMVWLDSMEKLEIEIQDLQLQLTEEDRKLQAWEERIKTLESQKKDVKGAPNPYRELIENGIEEKSRKVIHLEGVEKEFQESTKLMDLYAFLKYVFSREGVVAQIIETSFGSLQSLANRYLTRICSEGLLLTIVPQRELKKKTFKEEIDIYVTSRLNPNQKIPIAALSGGQKQRINIALLMALYKFCRNLGVNNFGFLILDEILDLSLATKGQTDVIGLMRDLLLEIDQILVVSHKMAIAQDFDREIIIRRNKEGVSAIV